MDRQALTILFMVGVLIFLIICAVKGEMENLLTFIMRGLLGSLGIHLTNFFLGTWGITLSVGINLYTFLTSAFLGIPGFLGLYALGFYQLT